MTIEKNAKDLKLLYTIFNNAMTEVGWKTVGFTLDNRNPFSNNSVFDVLALMESPPIKFPQIYYDNLRLFKDEINFHKDSKVLIGMLLKITPEDIYGKWRGCIPGVYHMSCSTGNCTDVRFQTNLTTESALLNAFKSIPVLFQAIVDHPNEDYIEHGSDHTVVDYARSERCLWCTNDCFVQDIISGLLKIPDEYIKKLGLDT